MQQRLAHQQNQTEKIKVIEDFYGSGEGWKNGWTKLLTKKH